MKRRSRRAVDLLAPAFLTFPSHPHTYTFLLVGRTPSPFTPLFHTSCPTSQAFPASSGLPQHFRGAPPRAAAREQLETNDGYLNQGSTQAWTKRHGSGRLQCIATLCRALSFLTGARLRGPIQTWTRENASWNTDMPACLCCGRSQSPCPASTLSCPGHKQHTESWHAAIPLISLSPFPNHSPFPFIF
jgi:hypothetical protein